MTREQIRRRLVALFDEVLAQHEADLLREQGATSSGPPAVLSTDEEHNLAGIIEALRRVDAGVYSICTSCGESIGGMRLLEEPTTVLCAECANEDRWRPQP